MINEWVYDYLRNMVLDVYNPDAYRPFLHIEDACRAIETSLMDAATRNETFNVAGFNITKLELAATVTSVGECNYNTYEQTSDNRDYQVNTEKFHKATNFTYQHTIKELEVDLEKIRHFAIVRKTSNVEDFVMPL